MLNDLTIFCTVVEQHTFSAAAHHLGLSPSTVSKSIARLEAKLSTQLFHRNTRHIKLSLEGQSFYAQAQHLLTEANHLIDRFAHKHAQLEGHLKIDLPAFLGRYKLLTALNKLAQAQPKLQFEVNFSDTYNDLITQATDITVRIGQLPDSGLIAKPIGLQDWVLCCSARFYQIHQKQLHYENLAEFDAITYKIPSLGKIMPWRFKDQKVYPAQPRFVMTCGEAIKASVLADLGIAQLPNYFVERELVSGELIELFPELRPIPSPIYAVTSYKSWHLEKIKATLTALDAALNS